MVARLSNDVSLFFLKILVRYSYIIYNLYKFYIISMLRILTSLAWLVKTLLRSGRAAILWYYTFKIKFILDTLFVNKFEKSGNSVSFPPSKGLVFE